jgi:hypothetical protein
MKEHPAKLLIQEEIVIPGKRSATRNPVPLGAGFKPFWIPVGDSTLRAFAGMTDEVTFAGASENLFIFSAFPLISSVLSVPEKKLRVG